LNWRILPDDRTESFVEIWLPPPAASTPASRVTVTIKDPTQHSFTIDEIHVLRGDRRLRQDVLHEDPDPPGLSVLAGHRWDRQ
jgi:hypothetical protein